MTYPSDKQIEAGVTAFEDVQERQTRIPIANHWNDIVQQYTDQMNEAISAAIIAARDADPPPSMAEFERAAIAYGSKCFTFGMQGHSFPELGDEVDALRTALRAMYAKAAGHEVPE